MFGREAVLRTVAVAVVESRCGAGEPLELADDVEPFILLMVFFSACRLLQNQTRMTSRS